MISQNPELHAENNGGEDKQEWYYNSWTILGAILFFGPLGLFPLWFRPKTNIILKVVVSILVLAATVFMTKGAVYTYQSLSEYYAELEDAAK